MVIAIGTLPVVLLEIIRGDLPESDRLFLDIVNWGVLVVFLLDYLVELVLSKNRKQYVRHEWTSALIVMAQLAALAPALTGATSLKALRGARLARAFASLIRLLAIGGAAAAEGRTLLRRHAASLALGAAALTWVTSAVAFSLAEGVGSKGRVGSFFDALWWSSATITTVGYGDIYPVTAVGRIVGVFTMLIGISAFAVVTAKVADFLMNTGSQTPPDQQANPR